MPDTTQEISEDYDHDSPDPFGPLDIEIDVIDDADDDDSENDPFRVLDEEDTDCTNLDEQINQLVSAAFAIEEYGMSPSVFRVLKISGLLAGTSLDALGTENFSITDGDSVESEMAIESLLDSAKEKMAALGAKIINFTKNSCGKILAFLEPIKNKIFDVAKSLTQKTWDATKDAAGKTGKAIKAHPFKAIMAAVAAIAVVGTILAVVASPGAFTNNSVIKGTLDKISKLASSIKSPFTKVAAEVKTAAPIRNVNVYTVSSKTVYIDVAEQFAKANATTASELGWSARAVASITNTLGSAWNSIKSGVGKVGSSLLDTIKLFDRNPDKVKRFVGNVTEMKTGSKLAGWIANKWAERAMTAALWSVTGLIVALLKDVVLKGFRMVLATFNQLRGSTTETKTATA